MNKKYTVALACMLGATTLLTACGNKEPVKTPDTSTTPPAVEEQITLPENTETQTPEVENIPIELPEAAEGLGFTFPGTNIEIGLPDNWDGKYAINEVVDEVDSYPTVQLNYIGEDADKFNQILTLVNLNVDKKADVVAAYGEDFIAGLGSNAVNLGEYLVPNDAGEIDTYVLIMTVPDYSTVEHINVNDIPEEYNTMVNSVMDENNRYVYIPFPVIIDEAAKPFVDAIEAARDDETNQYMPVSANMQNDIMYLNMLGLTEEDVEAFAISTSLMNVRAYNVSVIKPLEGKGDVVKAALETYKANTIESFTNYLVDQLEIAEAALIEEVNGNYVIVMSENAEAVMESIKTALN